LAPAAAPKTRAQSADATSSWRSAPAHGWTTMERRQERRTDVSPMPDTCATSGAIAYESASSLSGCCCPRRPRTHSSLLPRQSAAVVAPVVFRSTAGCRIRYARSCTHSWLHAPNVAHASSCLASSLRPSASRNVCRRPEQGGAEAQRKNSPVSLARRPVESLSVCPTSCSLEEESSVCHAHLLVQRSVQPGQEQAGRGHQQAQCLDARLRAATSKSDSKADIQAHQHFAATRRRLPVVHSEQHKAEATERLQRA
jgi:hypothetical protein